MCEHFPTGARIYSYSLTIACLTVYVVYVHMRTSNPVSTVAPCSTNSCLHTGEIASANAARTRVWRIGMSKVAQWQTPNHMLQSKLHDWYS